MFMLVILNKGFKRKCHFNRFISFILAQVTRVFQQSGNICKILEEGILGNICEKPYIF